MRSPRPLNASVDESYFEKLLRHIPADIVAAYTALDGVIRQAATMNPQLYWIVFLALLVLTPLYTCYLKTEPSGISMQKVFPCIASIMSFVAWVFALGGPFAAAWPSWYQPVYGSVALILTTLLLPVLERIFYKTASDG
jgi:hypothetical protein